jgi:NTE family protein
VAFEDIADAEEREFFLNLPTSFSLTATQADCLIDRGPRLLRDSKALNAVDADGGPLTFVNVATQRLFGRVIPAATPTPAGPCRVPARR